MGRRLFVCRITSEDVFDDVGVLLRPPLQQLFHRIPGLVEVRKSGLQIVQRYARRNVIGYIFQLQATRGPVSYAAGARRPQREKAGARGRGEMRR
jgi:hypothetical protein